MPLAPGRAPEPTPLDMLVSRYGLVSWVSNPAPSPTFSRVWGSSADLGRPGFGPLREGTPRVHGGGKAWDDPAPTRTVAIAEAAERYAGFDLLGEERRRATADELGGVCLEPWRYPRCAPEEYARAGDRIVPFDPGTPIRWSQGVDLLTGEPRWVPAVMACYGVDAEPAERFTCRISTGYAVHTDPVEAVVRAICEVIERDANALVWLQQLSLPQIDATELGPHVAGLVAGLRRRFLDAYLFDATTDLGVPTVYCVLAAEHDALTRRAIGASCGRSLVEAAGKALHEVVSLPATHHAADTPAPDDPQQMREVGDTARYMGLPEHAPAFDFLLTASERGPRQPHRQLPDSSHDALRVLLRALADAGTQPVIVDRTTRELAEAGLTAVNAVIPDLQPMCLDPTFQFTAHSRLYEAPARMGYRVLPPEGLNPWPQPFA